MLKILNKAEGETRTFTYPSTVLSSLYVAFWVPFLFVGCGVYALKLGYSYIGAIFVLQGALFLFVFFKALIQYATIYVTDAELVPIDLV